MAGIAAGTLNRRIRIEQPVDTQDPVYGTAQTTWAPLATVWAEVQDVLPSRSERIDDNVSISRRPARIRMRYRRDVTSDMRIVFGDRVMRIVAGPAELGNREGLEIMAEELSTEGQEP